MKLRVALALALLLMPRHAQAQEPEMSPEEQAELFQSLPPEQQQMLLEQVLRERSGEEGAEAQPVRKRSERATRDDARARSRDRSTGRSRDDDRLLSTPLSEDDRLRLAMGEDMLEAEPRLEAQSEIIIELQIAAPKDGEAPLSLGDRDRLNALRDRIRRGNPYRLDRSGRLQLPDFEPIPMLGLNEELAAMRLSTDPDLSAFQIKVTLLPLEPTGEEGLEPFGYDLFAEGSESFTPLEDAPVPADYIVGPGDELRVQLFGSTNRSLRLEVGRDGQVDFPQIGPIAVAGMSFDAAKKNIESRVADQMIGVRSNVEMGETRTIQVFLLGEVPWPGSYTVSGLSTVTHALFAGGGITRVGSLRSVQLKRSGQVVRTLDLYDLLLEGDTSNDARLSAGDAVFIPPAGAMVSVSGEVQRPAQYEIRGGEKLGDVVRLAGGLTPRADARAARLERINERGERSVTNVDLSSPTARALALRTGDRLRVLPIRDTLDGAVVVDGHVLRPGAHEFRPGLRLSDVLAFEDLKPRADTHYVVIRREIAPDRQIVVLSADLAAAWKARGSEADVLLEPRDRLLVFDREAGRDRAVAALLREVRLQATRDIPLQVVSIAGRVRAPGEYPLEPGMRISDLLRAGGSLDDAAYGGEAEITRYQVVDGDHRETDHLNIDLGAVLANDPMANLELRPYDALTVKELPQWSDTESVTIAGEVRFPGTYPLRRGETLSEVIQRAGGLTDLAFPEGAAFTREDLRQREQQQLDQLSQRLRRDLAVMALQRAQPALFSATGQDLLARLESAQAVGRLVIDLEAVIDGPPRGPSDITLRDGDRLNVPRDSQEVTVIGEVQNPTSHRYAEGMSSDEYIAQSGGVTGNADSKRIYVVRANGSVEPGTGERWYQTSSQIRPGDTIVVPLDSERVPRLPLWTAITQILYNIAIAVVAVGAL